MLGRTNSGKHQIDSWLCKDYDKVAVSRLSKNRREGATVRIQTEHKKKTLCKGG